MLILSQINIYPVKSLDGFSPISAVVEERGLRFDRRWMIVDENGMFLSQRTHRKMTFLRARIDNQQLIIEEKNNLENNIALNIDDTEAKIKVQVWDDSVEAVLVHEKGNEFLTNFLGVKCFLVKMPENAIRRIDEDYNTGEDVVSFADGFPYLIIGESSLNDLNSRLGMPLNAENQPLIGMRRFRTNFVFSGGKAYEEENWSNFKIGDVDFKGMKPCGRCVMTTLNPDTGEGGKEPLAKLAQYRQTGKKIPFGQNVIWLKKNWNWAFEPEVKLGDVIKII